MLTSEPSFLMVFFCSARGWRSLVDEDPCQENAAYNSAEGRADGILALFLLSGLLFAAWGQKTRGGLECVDTVT